MPQAQVEDGETSLSLTYTPPDIELAEYISPIYDFRIEGAFYADQERANFAQLRFMLNSSPNCYRFVDGHVAASPPVTLVGPTSGPTRFIFEGPAHVVGCGLMARGWAAICDLEADAMLDRVVDARQLFGASIDAVTHALIAAPSVDARAEILFALIRRSLRRVSEQTRNFSALVNRWLAHSDSPDVETLIAAAGLSRRQVERLCRRLYGMPPKYLARKYRALKASVILGRDGGNPTDLCAEHFYDQSHLSREVKEFAGMTPCTLRDKATDLTRLTMTRTRHNVLPIVALS